MFDKGGEDRQGETETSLSIDNADVGGAKSMPGGGLPCIGDIVERDIDGIWFPAKVMDVHQPVRAHVEYPTYDLTYLDDGKREYDVNFLEVRMVGNTGDYVGAELHSREEHVYGTAKPSDCRKYQQDLLEKGEEDVEATFSEPKVTIHASARSFDSAEGDGSATAYIINGPETNVATGSGLRGIRWLRGT